MTTKMFKNNSHVIIIKIKLNLTLKIKLTLVSTQASIKLTH